MTKHLTKTSHFNLITGIVTSGAWFDKLTPELQTILREESLAAGDWASRATEASLAKFEEDFKARGMTVAEVDKTPFIEATRCL